MAKADGVVTRDEILAFKEAFKVPKGEMENVSRVFNLAKQDIVDYESYAKQLASLLRDNQRLLEDVLEGLFHVALADRVFHPSEELKSMRHHLSTKQPQAKWVSLHAVIALRKQGVPVHGLRHCRELHDEEGGFEIRVSWTTVDQMTD